MVKSRHSGASKRLLVTLLSFSAPVFGAAPVEKVSTAQRTAALEFISAAASGDPQAVASTIHPDDLRSV